MHRIALIATLLIASCAPTSAPAPAGKQAFELIGSRIIACCCAAPCPCRLNEKPMHCHGCDHTDAVHVDKGYIGETDMSGVSWVVVGRGFGEKVDANWVYVYVGDQATDAQFKALQAMMTADLKAWGAKAEHLAGKFVGMRKAPITYRVSPDKNDYDCLIPGILELRTKAHYNPGHKEPVVSTGIMDAFGDRFVHADCLAHKYNDATINYSYDLTGRQCNQADFVLNEERVKKGGIGWGCWTANVQFGDKARYQEQMIEHDKK